MRDDITPWRRGRFHLKTCVSNLLDKVIEEAVENAEQYILNTRYATFAYGERQMNSILAPAFHNNVDAMILEYPSTRRIGSRNHTARADYFCLCNKGKENKYRMFVELKSSWQTLPIPKDRFNESNIKLYKTACRQIRGLENEFKGSNKKFYEGTPIIRVNLMTLALYTGEKKEFSFDSDYIEHMIQNASEQFCFKKDMYPNHIAVWKLDDKIKIDSEWENDTRKLRGIMFICHVMEPYSV
jgi:hypothetical protein